VRVPAVGNDAANPTSDSEVVDGVDSKRPLVAEFTAVKVQVGKNAGINEAPKPARNRTGILDLSKPRSPVLDRLLRQCTLSQLRRVRPH
jgi:hypothetical protein